MEIIVKNADFSACGIGQSISPAVIEMMAKYTNYKDDEQALQAMQGFYNSVGAETLSKCTVIVPCLAANVVEAMKDLVTDTDIRADTFNNTYFDIVSRKGLIGTSTAGVDTRKYRSINAVNGSSSVFAGQLKMFSFVPSNENEYLSNHNSGYIMTEMLHVSVDEATSLVGLENAGLTIVNYQIKGFDITKGIVGVLDSNLANTKYTILDWNNNYSTLRATDGPSNSPYNSTYICQGYDGGYNINSPICMFVWGIGITDNEALTIRDAMYQFKTDMGIE